MAGVMGVLALSALIFAWEIKPLLKQNMRKDLWAFCLLMLLATGLMVAEVLGIPIPNPMEGIAAIFSPVSGWFRL